ncbi:MAG TPA: heat-inducible transcriptional repressor HrcA [Erysipelothrix sp.]|nr:heat-inducible transcriptional repressor HrcA [Erysipelothrix sp.]
MLTPRKIEIFKAIVKEFIQTAEPVGSKLLIDKYNINYSSATIRNEMSDLEKIGLIEKTHTSSGRVPSSKGYRFYVEHFMEDEMHEGVENVITQIFSDRRLGVEEAIRQSVNVLTQMTQLTSMVLGPASNADKLKSVQLIPINNTSAMAVFVTELGHAEHRIFNFEQRVPVEEMESCTAILNDRLIGTPLNHVVEKMESIKPVLSQRMVEYEVLFEAFVNAFMKFAQDEIYYSGKDNMLYQPEFASVHKLREMTELLENSQVWQELSTSHENLKLKKGVHSELMWIDDVAVVSSSFYLEDEKEEHKLMVVGPSRMEYGRVVSLVEYVTQMIESVYGRGGSDE